MYRRIPVPLDGSETAEKVLPVVKTDCDLIIIGSRGETGALRWRFRSAA